MLASSPSARASVVWATESRLGIGSSSTLCIRGSSILNRSCCLLTHPRDLVIDIERCDLDLVLANVLGSLGHLNQPEYGSGVTRAVFDDPVQKLIEIFRRYACSLRAACRNTKAKFRIEVPESNFLSSLREERQDESCVFHVSRTRYGNHRD